jgi:hypothetical protein
MTNTLEVHSVRTAVRFNGIKTGAALAIGALACWTAAVSAQDNREPEVPARLVVQAGNKVSFQGHGIGVQVYAWSGSAWVFQFPEAVLFDNDGNIVATHFAGPTWRSNSGSMVVGSKIDGVTVDPTAIPWLILSAKSTDGSGILARTTFIQRVNTVGGLAPATAGTTVGEVAEVGYEADYFFYRQQ